MTCLLEEYNYLSSYLPPKSVLSGDGLFLELNKKKMKIRSTRLNELM